MSVGGEGSTIRLARWITNPGAIPQAVIEQVKTAVLDTIGCALYGLATPWASAIRAWVGEGASTPEAALWGTGVRARACEAALANGVAAHAFELDDYHHAKVHPGAVVIPAALAEAERIDASGARLLRAIVVGYEVMIRSALALDPIAARLRGWHLTGVTGTLGAAAACAVLAGLDAEHTAWALGLAGTQSSGLFAFNVDGAMSKRFHAGRAAQAGVMAVQLAARGFTGPTAIYEAQDGGLLQAFSDGSAECRLTDGLGDVYYAGDVSFKPYSCCGSTHAYIDAARALRGSERLAFKRIAKVRIGVGKTVRLQCGFDYQPSTALHAQMSLSYCVAVALRDGTALPGQFATECLGDPDLLALIQRTELIDDARLDRLYPEHFAGWVGAEIDGRELRVDVDDPSGSAARPLDRQAIAEKIAALLASGDREFGSTGRGGGAVEAQAPGAALRGAVEGIECGTVRDLVSAMADQMHA